MSISKLQNRLAYVGALVVLTAVLAAANSAFAEEPADATGSVADQAVAAEAINGAKEAARESADEAAEALKLENDDALENQLADISSTLIAAND